MRLIMRIWHRLQRLGHAMFQLGGWMLIRNTRWGAGVRLAAFGVLPLCIGFWLFQNYRDSRLFYPIPEEPAFRVAGALPEEFIHSAWIVRVPFAGSVPDPQILSRIQGAGVPAFWGRDPHGSWWIGVGPEPGQAEAEAWIGTLRTIHPQLPGVDVPHAQVVVFDPLQALERRGSADHLPLLPGGNLP